MADRSRKDAGTFDALLQLKDAGLVAADGAATVGGQARIVDLGDARVDARVIVDVTALEVASGDERYEVRMQFSDSSSFASGIVNGSGIVLGDSSVTGASADSAATGRHEFGFTNDLGGNTYRYARLYSDVSGTIATGINFTAWIAKN